MDGTNVATLKRDSPTIHEFELPFFNLEEDELQTVCPGPRISSRHSNPKSYYGPVTIRNYLAGWTKQQLRIEMTLKSRMCYHPKIFLRLPDELKLVVLEHLHPIDLYHLSLASRYFRKLVMSPTATGVWKVSFSKHADLPRCPPTVAANHWAFLLFGPGICIVCNKYGALTDFAFRKQYCELCMIKKYSYINGLRDTMNRSVSVDNIVCSLLPRSYRYHGLRYTTSYLNIQNAKYLRSDFNKMMKKVTLIQVLIDHHVFPLAELFQEYKHTLAGYLNTVQRSAEEANHWAMDVFRQISNRYDSMFQLTTKRCSRRLLHLGHEQQDIDFVHFSLSYTIRLAGMYKLTSKAYRRVLPKLEATVIFRKKDRLRRERQELLFGIYRDYQKTLDPDEWQYLPHERLIITIKGFSSFIDAEYTSRGDISMDYAISLIQDFVSNWTRIHQIKILRLFTAEPESDFENSLKKLELATSVVTCGECKLRRHNALALFGWQEICRHKAIPVAGYYRPCDKYESIQNARNAASALISLVGLNPTTTTAQEMHDRNDRFLCGDCIPSTSRRGITGLKAYTWVECVKHTISCHPENSSPIWHLLSSEARRFVLEHEYVHPRPISDIWRCNKCAEHYSCPVTQREAVTHVEKFHLISKPVVGKDVVCDRRYSMRRRKPFHLGTDPGFEFQCQRCVNIHIRKLWEMQTLLAHLSSKHQISEPIEGEDWVKVQIIVSP